MNEFIWQDVELTEEFKSAYAGYLKRNRYDVEFLGATAVITSPFAKYIYVPNQWFVIASYVVDVCEELQRYKEYLKRVSDKLNKRPDSYAKYLRDSATAADTSASHSSSECGKPHTQARESRQMQAEARETCAHRYRCE